MILIRKRIGRGPWIYKMIKEEDLENEEYDVNRTNDEIDFYGRSGYCPGGAELEVINKIRGYNVETIHLDDCDDVDPEIVAKAISNVPKPNDEAKQFYIDWFNKIGPDRIEKALKKIFEKDIYRL